MRGAMLARNRTNTDELQLDLFSPDATKPTIYETTDAIWPDGRKTLEGLFQPDVVIGVGGYASGPVLRVATKLGIPCVLQEQNSFAGVTNRILGRKAIKICVAYDKMDRFFPSDKIVFTGNPVRHGLMSVSAKSREAYEYFKVASGQKVILVIGGSLGARTLNQGILAQLDLIRRSDIVIIWQSGKYYYKDILSQINSDPVENIRLMEFIPRMDLAYALADVVIKRKS